MGKEIGAAAPRVGKEMEMIKVPMLKEMFMEGLLDSITKGTTTKKMMVVEGGVCSMKYVISEPIEATMMRKYLNAKKNGEYLGPIGPLDEALTVFMQVQKKFFSKEVTSKEYMDAHKVYLASIKK